MYVRGVDMASVYDFSILFLNCPDNVVFLFFINYSSPARCDCDSVTFMAVCDDQKRTYYSPCHAGCTNSTSNVRITRNNTV